jgi:tetratricopeptide (TPR) repeat protein
MRGKFAQAQQVYLRAVRISQALADQEGLAESLAGVGLSLRAQGNPERALPYLSQAHTIYHRAHAEGEGFILWALGSTYRFCGDLRKAVSHFRKALLLARKQEDTTGTGYALCGLAGASRLMGRFADTQSYYQEANELFEAEGDVYGRAYSYCGLGNAARMRREYDLAMKLFTKAEKLYARIGDKASFAYTVWAMATVHKMQGHFTHSAGAFARAQALFRETRDHRGLIYCRLGVGELALLQGKAQTAQREFARSLEQAGRFGYHAEACHALAGLTLVDPEPDWAAVKKAYRQCGLHFIPSPPPWNLP